MIEQLTKLIQGDGLKALSGQLGQSEENTQSAITSALPVLLGALAKNSSSEEGANALAGALDRDHDGGILDNLGGLMGNAGSSSGAGILKHLLGDKQDAVTAGLSQMNGMDQGSMGTMLQSLAPMLMGFLGKQKREQGLDASGLGSLLGAAKQETSTGSSIPGLDMVMGLLDKDGDGSVMDDLMGSAGKGLLGKLFGKK